MKEKSKPTNKSLIGKSIAFLVLLAVTITLSLLKNNPVISEWFATHFARWWIFLFGNIFGWLPFSMYELFLVGAGIYIILFLVFAIINLCKKRWKNALAMLLTFAVVVTSFVTIYVSTAGMSYNRASLDNAIDFYEYDRYDFDIEFEESLAIIESYIAEYNYLIENVERDQNGNTKIPYSLGELGDIIGKDYDRVFEDNNYISPYNVKVKPIINKTIMSEMWITGVFFAPTGVATINTNTPSYQLPVVVAHEMAHGKGIMKEGDANMIAYYVCMQSQDMYVRYSGYNAIYSDVLNILSAYSNDSAVAEKIANMGLYDDNGDLIETVFGLKRHYSTQVDANKLLAVEIGNGNKMWSNYDHFANIGTWLNNIYLKLQGQQNGTGSYGDGSVIDREVETDEETGEEVLVSIYLSQIQRMYLQLYVNNKIIPLAK